MIKLLLADVDGTLTEQNGLISLNAVKALREVRSRGVNVALSSGRSVFETYTLSKFLGFSEFGISENGGVIFYREPLNVKIFGDISDALQAYEILSKDIPNVKISQRFPRLTEVLLERSFDISLAKAVLEKEYPRAKILDSGVMYHLSSVTVNKGVATKYLREVLGLRQEEVASVGDSEVDVPMFKESGYSFVVNNGFLSEEEVKELGNAVITPYSGPSGLMYSLELMISHGLIP